MEWCLVMLAILGVATFWNTQLQVGLLRRGLSRLNRRIDAIIDHLHVPFEEFPAVSDRVSEIARDPTRKIEAIKVYREETGAGLAEAKEAVETYMDSLPR